MNENYLDIFVTSDPHGKLPIIKDQFDLLLMAGDICPAHDHYWDYQINWFQHDFAKWVNSLPFKNEKSKIVIIPGNHDFFMERVEDVHIKCFQITTNHRSIILRNQEYDYEYDTEKGKKYLKIFGTPYCKIFYNWAFMLPDDKLKLAYSNIPDNCDILLTHDAPDINNLGLIQEGPYAGTNAGNKVLAEAIKEKKPKYCFCGHIHSGNHNLEKVNNTYMANVSYINERYKPSYDILKMKINKNTKKLEHDN